MFCSDFSGARFVFDTVSVSSHVVASCQKDSPAIEACCGLCWNGFQATRASSKFVLGKICFSSFVNGTNPFEMLIPLRLFVFIFSSNHLSFRQVFSQKFGDLSMCASTSLSTTMQCKLLCLRVIQHGDCPCTIDMEQLVDHVNACGWYVFINKQTSIGQTKSYSSFSKIARDGSI